MTYLKITKNPKWLDLQRTMLQAWHYPSFSVNTAPSQQIVSLAIDNGEISPADLELFRFLRIVKFATVAQIEHLFGKLGGQEGNSRAYLDHLVSDRYLNSFAISDIKDDRSWFTDEDALVVYALDFGAKYALIYESEDMSDWYSYQNRVGIALLGKYLLGTDLYISLMRMSLQGQLVTFKNVPEMFVNNQSAHVDYSFTYHLGNKDIPLVCYIARLGLEGSEFTDKMLSANMLFHSTKTWHKYFPLETKPPKLLIIVERLNATVLSNVYHVIHNSTKFDLNRVIFTSARNLQTLPLDSPKAAGQLKPNADKTIKFLSADIFGA